MAKQAPGIVVRHHRACPSRDGGACAKPCTPTYQAWVWSKRDGKKVKKSFPTPAAAKVWRADALSALNRGTLRASVPTTLREAWDAWLTAAEDGVIRNRAGETYKPSVLRSYAASMRLYVLDDLGARKLSDISADDLQALADRLVAKGLNPSTVRNTFMPLRALYRRSRRQVPVNPTAGLELPAVTGRRDRIASREEAASFLGCLPEEQQALWATALYAGLRLGELQALRDEDVDLAGGVIRVRQSWDKVVGPVPPKSRSGSRNVPIPSALRGYLAAHRLRRPTAGGLFFGNGSGAFNDDTARARAAKAAKDAHIAAIGFHECRHTHAAFMIAAGANAKALSTYMGHSSITITLDRYGHLMPGNETAAAALLDAYLAAPEATAVSPAHH